MQFLLTYKKALSATFKIAEFATTAFVWNQIVFVRKMAVLLSFSLLLPHSSSQPKLSRLITTKFPSSEASLRSSPSSSRVSSRTGSIRCQALGESSEKPIVYQGIYGPWSVDQSDVREVILYRSGLITAASSFVIAASAAFLLDNSFLRAILKDDLNLLYTLGAGGLGLSLFLIHIYVTEIKRTLQALWAVGVVGSLVSYLYLAQPVGQSLPEYVVGNPSAVWFVGPLFAALTGLVFKEGLCYGKLEAGILTFVIPTVLLGHLTGLMDDGVKLSLLGVWMALFVVFAARKFTQPVKDDIGDKSVFIFQALPENERRALLEKLEEQKLN